MTRPVITIPLKCNTARNFYHFLKTVVWIEIPITFILSSSFFIAFTLQKRPDIFGFLVLSIAIFSMFGTILDCIEHAESFINFITNTIDVIIDHIPRLECIKTDDDNGKDL